MDSTWAKVKTPLSPFLLLLSPQALEKWEKSLATCQRQQASKGAEVMLSAAQDKAPGKDFESSFGAVFLENITTLKSVCPLCFAR